MVRGMSLILVFAVAGALLAGAVIILVIFLMVKANKKKQVPTMTQRSPDHLVAEVPNEEWKTVSQSNSVEETNRSS